MERQIHSWLEDPEDFKCQLRWLPNPQHPEKGLGKYLHCSNRYHQASLVIFHLWTPVRKASQAFHQVSVVKSLFMSVLLKTSCLNIATSNNLKCKCECGMNWLHLSSRNVNYIKLVKQILWDKVILECFVLQTCCQWFSNSPVILSLDSRQPLYCVQRPAVGRCPLHCLIHFLLTHAKDASCFHSLTKMCGASLKKGCCNTRIHCWQKDTCPKGFWETMFFPLCRSEHLDARQHSTRRRRPPPPLLLQHLYSSP